MHDVLFRIVPKEVAEIDKVLGICDRRHDGLLLRAGLPALTGRQAVEEALRAIVEEPDGRRSCCMSDQMRSERTRSIRRSSVTNRIADSRIIKIKEPTRARYSRLSMSEIQDARQGCGVTSRDGQ